MKIEYIYEAGVFGSYKKANAQSNIDNAKKELTRNAALHILESKCDELAELYFDMLNEVNSKINAISRKYKYKLEEGTVEDSNLLELSRFTTNKYFAMSREKDMQLNLIKNIYCNRPAIEYMVSQGCFILPIVDTEHNNDYTFFEDPKEVIPYKNMIKTVSEAAENIIKTHISKFPRWYTYTVNMPNKVKIVILQNVFNNWWLSTKEEELLSYMGIKNNDVKFEYPVGQGSSCLNHILNNFTLLSSKNLSIDPTKPNEHIWKSMMPESSPWMYNKMTYEYIKTDLSAVSADNFYGIKMLKFALDNGILTSEHGACIHMFIHDTIKNMQSIHKLKQELSNNGLDKYVSYSFNDMNSHYSVLSVNIGKKLTSEKAKQEGFFIDDFEHDLYEFDYKDAAEVESAAKKIVNVFDKLLSDADKSTKQRIKQIAEDAVKNYLPKLMSRILKSKPHCVCYSNKILLSGDYKKAAIKTDNNLRAVIDPTKTQFNKKGNLVYYIVIDFSVPVRGINPKYIKQDSSRQTSEVYYEYIYGKQIKIEIPLI